MLRNGDNLVLEVDDGRLQVGDLLAQSLDGRRHLGQKVVRLDQRATLLSDDLLSDAGMRTGRNRRESGPTDGHNRRKRDALGHVFSDLPGQCCSHVRGRAVEGRDEGLRNQILDGLVDREEDGPRVERFRNPLRDLLLDD